MKEKVHAQQSEAQASAVAEEAQDVSFDEQELLNSIEEFKVQVTPIHAFRY